MVGCATGISSGGLWRLGGGPLPYCMEVFLSPHEVVDHKRCEAVGNAASDSIQSVRG